MAEEKVFLLTWGQNFLGEQGETHYSSSQITEQGSSSHGKVCREAEADMVLLDSYKLCLQASKGFQWHVPVSPF